MHHSELNQFWNRSKWYRSLQLTNSGSNGKNLVSLDLMIELICDFGKQVAYGCSLPSTFEPTQIVRFNCQDTPVIVIKRTKKKVINIDWSIQTLCKLLLHDALLFILVLFVSLIIRIYSTLRTKSPFSFAARTCLLDERDSTA